MANSAGPGPHIQQQKQCRCPTSARAAQQGVCIGACIAHVEVVVRRAVISHSIGEQSSCQCPAHLVKIVPTGHPLQAQAPAQQQDKNLELWCTSVLEHCKTVGRLLQDRQHSCCTTSYLCFAARWNLHLQPCCIRRQTSCTEGRQLWLCVSLRCSSSKAAQYCAAQHRVTWDSNYC